MRLFWLLISVLIPVLILLRLVLSVPVLIAVPILLWLVLPILLPVVALIAVSLRLTLRRGLLALVWPTGSLGTRALLAVLRLACGRFGRRDVLGHVLPVLVARAEGLWVAQAGRRFLLCPLADSLGVLQLYLILLL